MGTLQVDIESLFIHERYITDGAFDIFVSILAIFGISTDTSLNRCVIVFANLKAPRVSCSFFCCRYFPSILC